MCRSLFLIYPILPVLIVLTCSCISSKVDSKYTPKEILIKRQQASNIIEQLDSTKVELYTLYVPLSDLILDTLVQVQDSFNSICEVYEMESKYLEELDARVQRNPPDSVSLHSKRISQLTRVCVLHNKKLMFASLNAFYEQLYVDHIHSTKFFFLVYLRNESEPWVFNIEWEHIPEFTLRKAIQN